MTPPTFSPTTGALVPRSAGKTAIAAYKASTAYTANSGIKAFAFGIDLLNQVTGQTGCQGIRIWYGMDGENRPQLYIVAVDGNGDDILPTNAIVLNSGSPCPNFCPTTTSLEY